MGIAQLGTIVIMKTMAYIILTPSLVVTSTITVANKIFNDSRWIQNEFNNSQTLLIIMLCFVLASKLG